MFKKTMVVAMLGLLGAAPAFAHEGRSPEAQKEWKTERMNRLSEKLGLDAAGEARLQQIFEKFHAQAQPLMQDARATREALKAELASATPNDAKISALTGKLQSTREQMRAIGLKRSQELKAALTPTQYAKLVMGQHRFGRGFHKHERDNQKE